MIALYVLGNFIAFLDANSMMPQFPFRITRLLSLGLILLGAPALAATSDPVTAERFPMISLGLAIAVLGLVIAKAMTGKWDLDRVGKVRRGVGVLLASIGCFFVVFAAVEAPPTSTELPWYTSYEAAIDASKTSDLPLMIDFTADWCGACHVMEAEVFHMPPVRGRLSKEVVLLKVDFDEETVINEELRTRFAITGLPSVVFLSPSGDHLKGVSFEGKVDIPGFSAKLDALANGGGGVSKESDFAKTMREDGLLAALLLVFLAGVMSSLTPCVYPLIPITVGIFGAKGAESRFEGFLLSLVYVIGIAITYSALGVAAASFGSVFGGAMQSPWVLAGIAALFLILGLGSVGLFEFRLPGNLQALLSQTGRAGYVGALAMGLVAGVIAAPCVGPIVAGILVYVAQQQDIFLGGVLLMTFAFGMGMLFLVLGTFSSLITKIPRSGGWMETVKLVFGAVFIGMALYYGQFALPAIAEWTHSIWFMVG